VPLLALLLIVIAIGGAVAWLSLAVSRRQPGETAAQEIATAVAERPQLRRAGRRIGADSATGLMLVLALVVAIGGGLLLAGLAFLVRSDSGLVRLDRSVADWGQRHASSFTDDVLNAITFVGQPTSIGALAAAVAIAETIRTRNRWIVPFMFLVIAGTGLLTTTVKEIADRARPALNPIAETLGPSFPSGHSSWSAAFLAATALILSRHRGPQARALLAGVAAGLAVSVAATRVLLAVHWLTDVIAGLALGWAWFTACAIAFGGRVLTFGAGVQKVREQAGTDRRARTKLPSAPRHESLQD
jgi:undecaprenyl-diphosphatase